jgi:hypothetical protein
MAVHAVTAASAPVTSVRICSRQARGKEKSAAIG